MEDSAGADAKQGGEWAKWCKTCKRATHVQEVSQNTTSVTSHTPHVLMQARRLSQHGAITVTFAKNVSLQ